MADKKHIRTFRSKKLHPEHAKLLNEAIRKNARGGDHNVHISYVKADGTKSDRKVRPLAVKGKSLFVAHCHERNAIRSFKVERIDMIKKAFWEGFEKRAAFVKKAGIRGYAYAHTDNPEEARRKILNFDDHGSHEIAHGDKPIVWFADLMSDKEPILNRNMSYESYVKTMTPQEAADYAKRLKRSINPNFGAYVKEFAGSYRKGVPLSSVHKELLDDKKMLHEFADDLLKHTKNKDFKSFSIQAG